MRRDRCNAAASRPAGRAARRGRPVCRPSRSNGPAPDACEVALVL